MHPSSSSPPSPAPSLSSPDTVADAPSTPSRTRGASPLRRFLIRAVGALALAGVGGTVLLMILGMFQWEVQEMDVFTGSRREYVGYPFGVRTQVKVTHSALALHLAKRRPELLLHPQWESFSKISHGPLGTTYSYSRLSSGFFDLPGFSLDRFVAESTDAEILALYQLVRSRDEAAIQKRFEEIMAAQF